MLPGCRCADRGEGDHPLAFYRSKFAKIFAFSFLQTWFKNRRARERTYLYRAAPQQPPLVQPQQRHAHPPPPFIGAPPVVVGHHHHQRASLLADDVTSSSGSSSASPTMLGQSSVDLFNSFSPSMSGLETLLGAKS